eukprot:364964-Chlamydomonas_euryale.AAC.2
MHCVRDGNTPSSTLPAFSPPSLLPACLTASRRSPFSSSPDPAHAFNPLDPPPLPTRHFPPSKDPPPT